jgi:hypothetical protein
MATDAIETNHSQPDGAPLERRPAYELLAELLTERIADVCDILRTFGRLQRFGGRGPWWCFSKCFLRGRIRMSLQQHIHHSSWTKHANDSTSMGVDFIDDTWRFDYDNPDVRLS